MLGNGAGRGSAGGGLPGYGREPIDGGRKAEVRIREAPGLMGGEREEDLVPADVDVGMMSGTLGATGDGIDETHGLAEVGELKGADDGFSASFPLRKASEARTKRGGGEPFHGRTTGSAETIRG